MKTLTIEVAPKKTRKPSPAEAAKRERINKLLDESRADLPDWHGLPPWEAEAILERKKKVEDLESFFQSSLTSNSLVAPAGDQLQSNSGQKKGSVMSLTFEIKAGAGVPAGFYKARFKEVEQTEHDEYGAGLKFVFEVVDGEQKGGAATRITSPSPTPKNAAGRMIAGITGTSLVPGAKIDLAPFVGKLYLVQVENVASGNGTRISTVMPSEVSG